MNNSFGIPLSNSKTITQKTCSLLLVSTNKKSGAILPVNTLKAAWHCSTNRLKSQTQFISPKLDEWASGTTTWAQHKPPAINSHHSFSDPFCWMWRAWLCPQLHQYHRSYRRVSDLPTINIHTIYPEQWAPSRTPNSPPPPFFSTGH